MFFVTRETRRCVLVLASGFIFCSVGFPSLENQRKTRFYTGEMRGAIRIRDSGSKLDI